jgi:CHASE3 domain sensor protein
MKAYERILETFEKFTTERIKEIGRLEKKDFIRERKMPFADILRYILSQKGKTITMEINNYFKEVNRRENRVTKQAFCSSAVA